MSTAKTNTADNAVAKLAGRFYRDRRLMVLTLFLAIASGLSSLTVLPRLEDPVLRQRAGNVTTIYPGANAERVESLVTEKIEDRLLDVPEIKRLRSSSRAGVSFISIELRDEVIDTDPVWSEIRGKIEDSIAMLPPGAGRPLFNDVDVTAYAWIGCIVWDRDETPAYGVMRRIARELKDVLIAVSGTKEVELFGDPQEEILVEVKSDRASAAGLSAADVAAQLRSSDVKSSLGILRNQHAETVVEMKNEFESVQDILNVNLQTNQPGQTLRLEEIADVRRGIKDPPAARSIFDGKPAVTVAALLLPDFRIDAWSDSAKQVVADFESRLPQGVRLDIVMQQSDYVAQRMRSLAKNLLLGVSAVAVVTFLFLGWRSSLLVTATLPVASLMVIAGMRFLGIPIHQMSITGLIIALGLLIDNAIIAADEIELSLRRGFGPEQAVRDMVGRLFAPLVASTVTTALAFAPIALMEGPAGEFVGSIAITVMLAIFSSLFLSLTILPAAAALLQKSSHDKSGVDENARPRTWLNATRDMTAHGIVWKPMTRVYTKFLYFLFRHPALGIALGCVLPFCGFAASTQLGEQFFPPSDRDQFYVELELQPQAAMAQTEAVITRADAMLHSHERVAHTTWFVGESAPSFYYNLIPRRKGSPNYAQAIITLKSNDNALAMVRQLQVELDRSLPEARVLVRQLEQGPPFVAPLELRIYGPNLDVLKDYGEQFRMLATQIPNVLHVNTTLSESRPVAEIALDADQAQWAGLQERQVADQIFARLEGLPAGSIIEQVEQIPVRVRIGRSSRSEVQDLGDTTLLVSRRDSPSGSMNNRVQNSNIALTETTNVASLATISLKPQRAVVTRYKGRRTNDVQGYIVAGTLPSEALAAFQTKLKDSGIKLPPGYSYEVGGEASERNAAVGRLMANVSILAVGMVAALVMALASFRLAGLIGLVAVLSVGLGLGSLWVFGYPFGFMAIIGTMGLIGIAINDSIVVVAALKANDAVRAGELDATVETVVEVTRHVLATTATTIVGFLPLLLSGGGFWPPLAVAIGAGVTGATIISLTLVPCAMRLFYRCNIGQNKAYSAEIPAIR